MGDEQDCFALLFELFKFVKTFRLKKDIPDRKCFIHDQNFRIDVDRDREREAHEHTGGIHFDRLIDVLADVRERKNRIHPGFNFLLGKADHRTIEIDVLNAVVLHVEAGAQFQKRGNAPVHLDLSGSRRQDARDDLQDCRFSGAVRPDDADGLAFVDRHVDIVERHMFGVARLPRKAERVDDAVSVMRVQFIFLFQMRYLYRDFPILHRFTLHPRTAA